MLFIFALLQVINMSYVRLQFMPSKAEVTTPEVVPDPIEVSETEPESDQEENIPDGVFGDRFKNIAASELLDFNETNLKTVTKSEVVQLLFNLVEAIKDRHPKSWNEIRSKTLKLEDPLAMKPDDDDEIKEPEPEQGQESDSDDDNELQLTGNGNRGDHDYASVIDENEKENLAQTESEDPGAIRKCGECGDSSQRSYMDMVHHHVKEHENRNQCLGLALIFRADVGKSKNGKDYEIRYKQVTHKKFKDSVKSDQVQIMCLQRPCTKILPGLEEFQKHCLLKHDDQVEHLGLYLQCSICSRADICIESRMVEHCKIGHDDSNAKTRHCLHCHKEFDNKIDLDYHVKLQHEKLPENVKNKLHRQFKARVQCRKCTLTFKCKKTMLFHLAVVHDGVKPLTCEFCPRKTLTKMAMVKHRGAYHSEKLRKPFTIDYDTRKCKQCGRQFKHPSELKSHIERIHEKKTNYQCDICGKAFYFKHIMLKHQAIVHKDQASPYHGKDGKQIRSTVRSHECQQCDKAFYEPGHLRRHVKDVHDQIKDQICQYCGKAFSQASNMYQHIRNYHKHGTENITIAQ